MSSKFLLRPFEFFRVGAILLHRDVEILRIAMVFEVWAYIRTLISLGIVNLMSKNKIRNYNEMASHKRKWNYNQHSTSMSTI